MKKVIFILALVALAIGSVYAGSVIGAPAVRTSGPVQITTFSGSKCVGNATDSSIQYTYPAIRHVSLTVQFNGIEDSSGYVWVIAHAGNIYNGYVFKSVPSDVAQTVNIEFDTDSWYIQVKDTGGVQTCVNFSGTVMYVA
jgi:hypothetical protein